MPAQPDRRGQGQRMAGAGLLLGRGNDPNVVAELPGDGFEQLEAASVHAVVVGEQDAHWTFRLCGTRSAAATANKAAKNCAIFATAWRFLHLSRVSAC